MNLRVLRLAAAGVAAMVGIVMATVATPAATESEITVKTANGTLYGTLTLPETVSGPIPVALIIAGSGPTDRNGTNAAGIPVAPYTQLAVYLANRNVATVRYDKRGIAGSAHSAPLGNPPTFTSYVDDVVDWVKQLRADKRFSRVVLVGHSEGSLLALLAAAKTPVDGIVSLEGAGRPALDIIVEQLKTGGTPADLLTATQQVGAAIRDGTAVPPVPPELMSLFPPELVTYEHQWFTSDPAAAAAAITTPLLVIQGGADIQITMVDAKRLADAHPGAQLRTFPLMTHVLMDAKDKSRDASLATYTDTSLEIDPAMAATVAAFILQQPM